MTEDWIDKLILAHLAVIDMGVRAAKECAALQPMLERLSLPAHVQRQLNLQKQQRRRRRRRRGRTGLPTLVHSD